MINYPRSVSASTARMLSYAQNGEDVLIDRVLRKPAGFFIDVGAFHPIIDSVTKHFSQLGWRGINIEPDPEFFALLAQDRPNEINICAAVGRQPGQAVLHRLASRQCSTISEAHLARMDQASRAGSDRLSVPMRTLADICAEHVRGDIDFLKIDVEGAEADVVAGADWRKFRPILVVVEATHPGGVAAERDSWEPTLLSHDYRFQHFDGINRYYLRAEDEALASQLSAPLNYLDWYLRFADVLEIRRLGPASGLT
jgi:FkbM family methyltransferase